MQIVERECDVAKDRGVVDGSTVFTSGKVALCGVVHKRRTQHKQKKKEDMPQREQQRQQQEQAEMEEITEFDKDKIFQQ